ncbi:cytochrome b [Halomonas sp. HP20-15]|uniref:cytochrome b n=1 Tax=Halomonas sp. HP20-15 TaxID=3085901 RepID=UPI0029818BC4|nr:cytochrome b [Halomonas sp. HP20-15]MDW5375331.1 cytochrome b [Halomonas sp. HP20-15]
MIARYTYSHRLLHWLIAGLVIGSLASGMTLGWLGFESLVERFGKTAIDFLYQYHKTFGLLILGLMTLRLIIRLVKGKPAYAEPLPTFNRVASSIVHTLLYLLLFIMPILGWLATDIGDFPVEFFEAKLPGLIAKNPALSESLYEWHGRVGWAILVLALIHISAALYHWRIRRDGVMQRMSLFQRRDS